MRPMTLACLTLAGWLCLPSAAPAISAAPASGGGSLPASVGTVPSEDFR